MPGQLSVNDRVLLHLSRFATDTPVEEYPSETTQVGIAEGVGISRTHVPRAVRTLMKEGLVEEFRGRVANRNRRMSVYAVSMEGLHRAEAIWDNIRKSKVTVSREGAKEEVDGTVLEETYGRRRAFSLISRMKDGVIELSDSHRTAQRDLGDAPPHGEFFGRERELEALEAFLDSDAQAMVVLGGSGYGTTGLMREFVERQEDIDVLWITVREHSSAAEIESRIIGFAGNMQPEATDLESALAVPGALIVFDDYHSVCEGVVELLSSLINRRSECKIVVTAREDLPAYNWFYQKKHVDSGAVREIRVKGLDETNARRLLGNPDIEAEAFRRIFLMSRGQPLVLRLLRDGDREGLKKNSVFTAEEIRYLMFLSQKTD
jgi:DNA-binding Lrp family transcriptional regulator